MHPLTRFFNYLKRIDFSMALAREHIGYRELTGWYSSWMYELMETDEVRNQPYRDVIRESVGGKTVLELGTGRRALWAICCAKAGAKKVYAIEANPTAYQSSVKFLESQRLHNVHLIHGFSDKVELPERCEVLVHDLVGDIGSSEGMIPFIEDAKRRLLTPDAIHIPRRCTTHVVLAEDPQLTLPERAFSYLVRGFQRLESVSFVRFFGFPHEAALADPEVFEDIVFCQPMELHTNRELAVHILRDGQLRGVCFFIRLYLSESRMVDTWMSETSWSTPYVRLDAATSAKKGDVIQVNIRSDLSGNPAYTLTLAHCVDGSAREIGRYEWSGD
jgi:type I protein arginine methyltransferase